MGWASAGVGKPAPEPQPWAAPFSEPTGNLPPRAWERPASQPARCTPSVPLAPVSCVPLTLEGARGASFFPPGVPRPLPRNRSDGILAWPGETQLQARREGGGGVAEREGERARPRRPPRPAPGLWVRDETPPGWRQSERPIQDPCHPETGTRVWGLLLALLGGGEEAGRGALRPGCPAGRGRPSARG